MLMPTAVSRIWALASTLRRDRSGLAMMEFAFTLPLVMTMGGYGVELSYLSLTNLRVFQAAVNLADNASRVGTVVGTVTQLREVDVNDVLQGIRLTNQNIQLTTYGRIILSSLENVQQPQDSGRVQRIHWQRCMGLMGANAADAAYRSSYPMTAPFTDASDGTTIDSASDHSNEGVAAPSGIGDAGKEVKAPDDSGVMFVEVNYQYRPLFGTMFVSPQRIHYTQSFIVRDNRDFKRLYNLAAPNAATPSTCDLYTKGPGNTNT